MIKLFALFVVLLVSGCVFDAQTTDELPVPLPQKTVESPASELEDAVAIYEESVLDPEEFDDLGSVFDDLS